MDNDGVIPEDLLISYINFFRRNYPNNRDNIFQLCKFLKQEGIKNKYGEIKTHFNTIKENLKITPMSIVSNNYDDDYFEGGFCEDTSLRVAYQMALYNDFDRHTIN